MEEIWKDIEGYDGLYQVSNTGRVRSFIKWKDRISETPRILKQARQKTGYLFVGLSKDSNVKYERIHRLVAKAFLDNPENKPEVNHIDGDKTNNNLFNLEWATRSENGKHSYRMGLNWFSEKQYEKIMERAKPVQQTKNGNVIGEYESAADAHRKTGICRQNISKCCSGTLKTAGGYCWRYKNEC